MDKELILLNQKVDQLTDQIDILAGHAEMQQRRNREFEELKADLIPIGNQLIHLTINELEEIGSDFELEDLLYLLKRVLRNTHLILTMMDRFEALMGIADEAELLGKQVFSSVVETLHQLEQEGIFAEGSELIGSLAQRSTLKDINRMVTALGERTEQDAPAPSLFSLLATLNQPETRRGLARIINVLQALGKEAREE